MQNIVKSYKVQPQSSPDPTHQPLIIQVSGVFTKTFTVANEASYWYLAVTLSAICYTESIQNNIIVVILITIKNCTVTGFKLI